MVAVFEAVGAELTAAVQIAFHKCGTLERETSFKSNECARAARARQSQNAFDYVLAMATNSLLVIRQSSNNFYLCKVKHSETKTKKEKKKKVSQ